MKVAKSIKVINVTMSDSVTFLFIESFDVAIIQNCTFENATNRAVLFFLVDENLSLNQTTIDNCIFKDNSTPLEGAGLAFQGSKETSHQFKLNALITNCQFLNNKASCNFVSYPKN